MSNYKNDFDPMEGKIWLNCASEGAIPKVAAQAAHQAVEWKLKPYNMTFKRFGEIPKLLRERLGELIGAAPQDIILANSASYGIHLLANGFPFEPGDEILLMQNDFPTDIIPWLALEQKGVLVRQISSQGPVITAQELESELSEKTRLVCLPHVHTFSGYKLDIKTIGDLCQEKGIPFIVNFSQSMGNMPIDVSSLPVDGLTCAGFKWLMGPFGTGFCWMTPQLRERLDYNQANWGVALTQKQLEDEGKIELKELNSARKYDVFGTANFFNFVPWTKSVEYLLEIGLGSVQEHNMALVDQAINGLEELGYGLISPQESGARSNLVVFSHPDAAKNKGIFQSLIHRGIFPALWKNKIRIAPHIFNSSDDIAAFIEALKQTK